MKGRVIWVKNVKKGALSFHGKIGAIAPDFPGKNDSLQVWLYFSTYACHSQIKAVTSCSTHKIDQQETDG